MKNITIEIDENTEKVIKTFLETYTADNLDDPEKTIFNILRNIHEQIIVSSANPYQIINQEKNTIAVKIEYSRWLIQKFKKMGGKWNAQEKVWKLKNIHAEEMKELLDKYYDKTVIELEFNKDTEIHGEDYSFCDIKILEDQRDEYGRIERIKLSNDVVLIDGELPEYRGLRKGNGDLIFNESCKIRAEIPKFLLDAQDTNFEYGSFKTISR